MNPFNVIFCTHCNKIHQVESKTYIQVAGNVLLGQEDGMIGDHLNEEGVVINQSIFCFGSVEEPGCLEKYMAECRLFVDQLENLGEASEDDFDDEMAVIEVSNQELMGDTPTPQIRRKKRAVLRRWGTILLQLIGI